MNQGRRRTPLAFAPAPAALPLCRTRRLTNPAMGTLRASVNGGSFVLPLKGAASGLFTNREA